MGILFLFVIVGKIKNSDWTVFDSLVLSTVFLQAGLHARWVWPTGGQALGPRYLVPALPLVSLLLLKPETWKGIRGGLSTFLKLVVILSLGFELVQTSVKTQEYWTLKQKAFSRFEWGLPTCLQWRSSEENVCLQTARGLILTDPHWMANFKMFWNKLSGKSEQYRLTDFGGHSNRVIDLSTFTSFQGFNYWWGHIPRFLKQAKEASPKSEAVAQVDSKSNPTRLDETPPRQRAHLF